MLSKSREQMRMSRGLRSLTRSMLDRLPRDDSRRPCKKAGIEGYCMSCRKVTANELIVVGELMKARRCVECGRVMRASPLVMAECYSNEFLDRLGELIQRVEPSKLRSIRGHVHEIPSKVAGKVLREAGYVFDLFLHEDEWSKSE